MKSPLDFLKSHQYHIFLAVCIGLISFISFNLGKVSISDKSQLKVVEGANIYKATAIENSGVNTSDSTVTVKESVPKATPKPLDMRVVVSKASDSKKYHYSWCGTWQRIKIKNQLWFNNEQEAINAGYTLAGNCSR